MATLDLQQDLAFHAKKRLKRTIYVIMLCLALLILSAVALSLGGLSVSYGAIVKGLFVAYDPQVALIYDLRFPRIVIALLAGAGIAVSGVLFQAVLKNPISDPAIIGVCSGASFMVLLSSLLLPQLLLYGPILSFLGGGVSFLLIYGLAWK
ncbi:iron chelate uptake ABC transporter, FeCT family, permease protein, partial [Streptococcus dysgalactiae subsp. equisimilis SK1249]